jgi:aspartate-semialdehyde dehydrogenase
LKCIKLVNDSDLELLTDDVPIVLSSINPMSNGNFSRTYKNCSSGFCGGKCPYLMLSKIIEPIMQLKLLVEVK